MLLALGDDLQWLVETGTPPPAHEIAPQHEEDQPEYDNDIEDQEEEDLRHPPGGELRQAPLREAEDDVVQVPQGEEDDDGGQQDVAHKSPRLPVEVVREKPPRHQLERV